MNAVSQNAEPRLAAALTRLLPVSNKAGKPVGSIPQQLLQWLAVAALAFVSYLACSHFVIQSVEVVGQSMLPTLGDSQRYLLNHWVYHLHPPRRCDIVVLRDPSDNGISVKRVIAAPGDSVLLEDGQVYLNGRQLDERYLAAGTLTFPDPRWRSRSIRCGKDQFFVLGDNRANSVDSRLYGLVPRDKILGQIMW